MRPSVDVMRPRGPVVPEQAVDPAGLPAIRSEFFPAAGPQPWLDSPDADAAIDAALAGGSIGEDEARVARDFARDGFVVLPRFFDGRRLDAVWAAYERALSEGRVAVPLEPISADDVLPGRALNPHQQVVEIDGMLRDPALVAVMAMLLGASVMPFQTIVGHKGSQQREHSDSIHMTTYPLGFLAASWTAFEDIHADSGPLVYYPGSHRIPYIFSRDVGISAEDFVSSGYRTYHERYEPAVAAAIERHGLQPKHFEARKGDVLVWHANLIHGGAPRHDPRRSRKALVCHYFARGCVCYHDLASSLASVGPVAE